MTGKQIDLLNALGFQKILSDSDMNNLFETLAEVFPKYVISLPVSHFIEQTDCSQRYSDGFGVAATLSDGSSWYREQGLDATERQSLLDCGFRDYSLLAQMLNRSIH